MPRIWLTSVMIRRSYLSAMTPAYAVSSSVGISSQNATAPTQKLDCVSCQASQAAASLWAHMPNSDIAPPSV